MRRVGRNQQCPCGSGKKFKRCHGGLQGVPVRGGPSDAEFHELMRRASAKAEALSYQRIRQQGCGRPIITCEMQGTRFVAVGKKLAYGKWKTMPDFLLDHLRATLGPDWGNAELLKAESQQHPVMGWFRVLAEVQKRHQRESGEIFATPYYGACGAVTSLAYDLYTIEHHIDDPQAERSFELLLGRLRKQDQFFGARHECRVAGLLLRAGFELSWENEVGRGTGRHAEFIATFPETRRSFWVECRMRQPESHDSSFKFAGLVSDALSKPTDLDRLVFVELNIPDKRLDPESGGWAYSAITQLRKLEGQPNAEVLPAAEIVFSNFPEHHLLDNLVPGIEIVMESFKSDRYRMGREEDLWSAIKERAKNPELNALWRSIQEHHSIPATFDGSLPGVDEMARLVFGRRYELDDGVIGVLEEAAVVEQWKQAAGVLRLDDGRRVMVGFDLSDAELEAWRMHPETFFGELRTHHPPAKTPLDLFDFFYSCYRETPREKLIELMAGHPDASQLQDKPQSELAELYAYRLTVAAVRSHEPPPPPEWQRRLKRPKKVSGTIF